LRLNDADAEDGDSDTGEQDSQHVPIP
jgi:hypothetical protein